MNRREFIGMTAAAAATLAVGGARRARASASRPNILLVVSDDWGWPYYSFMQPEVGPCFGAAIPTCDLQQDPNCQPYRFPLGRTPTLDALAAGGICFPLGLSTAPKSAWARQSIQTGLNRRDLPHDGTFYIHREDDIPAKLAAGGRVTIPLALGGLGYKTYGLGKWEVDGALLSNFFNVNQPGSGAETIQNTNLHGPDLFRSFLDGPGQRPEPWFVMFAPEIPHSPYIAGATYDFHAFEQPSPTTCGDKPVGLSDTNLQRFLNSCTWVDTMVGDIVNELDLRGIRNDTIVMYTADHGAALARGKANFTENGLRTPIIANCPAPVGTPWRIPARGLHPALAGTIDIMPTILDYAREGQSSIPSWVPDPLDAVRFPDALSFRAVASGTTDDLRTEMFSNRDLGGDKSVRQATYDSGTGALTSLWKLYVSKTNREKALYDLLANPFENPKQNLVRNPAQAARIAALKQAIAAW
ncbi:MAG TPA: sulfatase-like hydrolase/transferase [Candidatus Binatia bacterium]|nr:sulfatase-like hydrolase/transferase [Candidatus Binatia bacterium]